MCGLSKVILGLFFGICACTPIQPIMSLEDAMLACRANVAKPVSTRASLGLSVGSGGRIYSHTGLSIGVDLGAVLYPKKTYENCVKHNSGQEPSEPLT